MTQAELISELHKARQERNKLRTELASAMAEIDTLRHELALATGANFAA